MSGPPEADVFPRRRHDERCRGLLPGAVPSPMNAPSHGRSDEALVAAIRGRDAQALSELYERHAGLLMSVAYRILNDRQDAEDLIHDVMLELWRKAENYDSSRGKVRSWLVLMTRSRAIDRVRALSTARAHAIRLHREGRPATSDHAPETSLDASLVRSAVGRLDETQRTVLQMNYFEGCTCQDIAERLNTPLGTVKSRLRAAVKRLRSTFDTTETRL